MAKKLYPEDAVQSIASAIRGKNGSSDLYKITDMASAIINLPQSGITPTGTSNIIANGIYDVTNFASASVAVPGASGTSNITSNGIYDITNFASVDVNVSGGGGDHDAEDALIERTISGAYTNSRVTSIGENAFALCSNLTSVDCPNVTIIGNNAFSGCNNLSYARFSNATSVGVSAFTACTYLETAIFPKLSFIAANAFNNAQRLFSFYLLASSVAILSKANAFNATAISSADYSPSHVFGSIYVPASLVSDYKAATNWSVYADRITSYVE